LKNRASVIRKIASEGIPAYFRPEIGCARPPLAIGEKAKKDVLSGLETTRLQRQWRARAWKIRLREEKAVRLWRLGRREPMREYLGVNFPPLLQHVRMDSEQGMKKDVVPWLKYLKWSGSDASSRSVAI
jgi:hypothetical protein